MSGALQTVFMNQRSFGTIPNAPTIGTATTSGPGIATVSFTAPVNDGGSVITSYTATSSPGGVTRTINQSGSGAITFTGLNSGASYTFTVTATNAIGTSAASSASNSVITEPILGQAFQGGYYAGKISIAGNGVASHYLIVGPVASAQNSSRQWKTTGTSTAGTDSAIAGPSNSFVMNNASHPAAQFCEGLTVGGFSDWYMPARNELEVCYFNLKPSTNVNTTNVPASGINPNAVPARGSVYTAGNPAQTSVLNFRTTGAEDFLLTTYWTSTQSGAATALAQSFFNGQQANRGKTEATYVRAVRRVAI